VVFRRCFFTIVWVDAVAIWMLKSLPNAESMSLLGVLLAFQIFVIVGTHGMRQVKPALLVLGGSQAVLLTFFHLLTG